MDQADFWQFLERSGEATATPDDRLAWLSRRLHKIALDHVVDFQAHLEAARGPIDTHDMWEAADLVLHGYASGDSFWYFQPWLIARGHRWWEHAARDPDNLVDLPAVQALAARPFADWSDDDWPWFESLAYAARTVYTERTGIEDGIEEALNERGIFPRADPSPPDPSRPFDGARHLPRLAALFPR